MKEQKNFVYPKLDYKISQMQERYRIVIDALKEIPQKSLTANYLQQLANYLTIEPKDKKGHQVLSDNRLVTINRRELSFQGLMSKFETGADGIYNLMTDGTDKGTPLTPKIQITDNDLKRIPGLKQLKQEIQKVERMRDAAIGKDKYLLTKMLIEMRQTQYLLKRSYKPPTPAAKTTKFLGKLRLDQKITVDQNGQPHSNGLISFFNPLHVCFLLCNYSQLKQETWGQLDSDLYHLMQDFDNLVDKALKDDYPLLYDIVYHKIDGMSNKDIAEALYKKHNSSYSIEYLSQLWRKKIPRLIAETAKKDWIQWHYTFEEYGKWKQCSRCKEIKLAHPYFYSKNITAKDGWYSMCKECRKKKSKKIAVPKKKSKKRKGGKLL